MNPGYAPVDFTSCNAGRNHEDFMNPVGVASSALSIFQWSMVMTAIQPTPRSLGGRSSPFGAFGQLHIPISKQVHELTPMRARCACLLVVAVSCTAFHTNLGAASASSHADDVLPLPFPADSKASLPAPPSSTPAPTQATTAPPPTSTPPPSPTTRTTSTPAPTETQPPDISPPVLSLNPQPLPPPDTPAAPPTTPPPPTTLAPTSSPPLTPHPTPTNSTDLALATHNNDASMSKAGQSTQAKTNTQPSANTNEALSEPTPTPTMEVVDTYRRDLNSTRTKEQQSGSRGSDEDGVPRVVGGREDRNMAAANETQPQNSDITAKVSRVYRIFKYFVSLSVVGSVLLLLFFHSLAVNDRFDWSRLSVSPNSWEFAVYVSYAQHLLSISQMVLVKTPYSLWTMLDGLSWAGFLPYHSSTSAITIAGEETSRRLDTILLSGLVAFADRVGVRETELLARTATNFVIFLGVLLVLFFVFAAVAKRQMDYRDSLPPGYTDEGDARIGKWSKISMQVCGLLVLLWIFALYPLGAMASYEVVMEARANTFAAGPLVLAVITLPVLCLGGALSLAYQVNSKSEYELREPMQVILWGSLVADYTYDKRAFLIAPVLLQIASGVVVGSVESGSVQACLLIALHTVFLLAVLAAKPFVRGSVAPWFLVALSLVKITNLSLALSAFTTTSSLSPTTRASVADAVIYLNALLVFCWLVRHVMMLVQTLSCLRDGRAQRVHDYGFHSQRGGLEEQQTPHQYTGSDATMFDSGALSPMSSYK